MPRVRNDALARSVARARRPCALGCWSVLRRLRARGGGCSCRLIVRAVTRGASTRAARPTSRRRARRRVVLSRGGRQLARGASPRGVGADRRATRGERRARHSPRRRRRRVRPPRRPHRACTARRERRSDGARDDARTLVALFPPRSPLTRARPPAHAGVRRRFPTSTDTTFCATAGHAARGGECPPRQAPLEVRELSFTLERARLEGRPATPRTIPTSARARVGLTQGGPSSSAANICARAR